MFGHDSRGSMAVHVHIGHLEDGEIMTTREYHILAFLFDQISTTIVNIGPLNNAIISDVEALSTWDHCDPRLADHVDCEVGEPCCEMDEWPSELTVGEIVADHIGTWLDDAITDETLRNMLGSIIDIHNREMMRLLGHLYIPDDACVLRAKVNALPVLPT